jgi:carbon-monoxide dehydrogenase medium subunit
VKPAAFEYHAPRELEEALDLLARHGDAAKVLAGGQSLVPLMNMRLARPAVLVDINRLPGLARLEARSDGLVLGALVRQRALERSPEVRRRAPLLAEAAPLIGHLPTRARGTVVGSCVHADPAAELPACAIALDATFTLRRAAGTRRVAAARFHVGLFATALGPDELVTEMALPAPPPRAGSAFVEVARRHGDFALVGAAAVVHLAEDGACREARLVFLGAGEVPHAAAAARQLAGRPRDAARLDAVARGAADELSPPSDVHATGAYRRRVAAVIGSRALARAWDRAAGGAA